MIYYSPADFTKSLSSNLACNLLGLDIGGKKIGVASCNTSIKIATPVTTLHYKSYTDIIKELLDLVKNKSVSGIIAGLPLELSGNKGNQALSVEKLVNKLSDDLKLPILLFDERLTTAMANNLLKQTGMKRKERNKKDDSLAATIILQNYLDWLTNYT